MLFSSAERDKLKVMRIRPCPNFGNPRGKINDAGSPRPEIEKLYRVLPLFYRD